MKLSLLLLTVLVFSLCVDAVNMDRHHNHHHHKRHHLRFRDHHRVGISCQDFDAGAVGCKGNNPPQVLNPAQSSVDCSATSSDATACSTVCCQDSSSSAAPASGGGTTCSDFTTSPGCPSGSTADAAKSSTSCSATSTDKDGCGTICCSAGATAATATPTPTASGGGGVGTCWKATGTSPYTIRDGPCGNAFRTKDIFTRGHPAVDVKVPAAFVVKQIGADAPAPATCTVTTSPTAWKNVRYMQWDGWVAASLLTTTPCVVAKTGEYGGIGMDVSDLCGHWDCIARQYAYAIPRIYSEAEHGFVDSHGGLSLQQAALAGMWTDAYMYVSGFDTSAGVRQANDVIAAIRDLPVGRVWIDVEGAPTSGGGATSWAAGNTPAAAATNRKLFEDIVNTFTNASVAVGLYTQDWQYTTIFGSRYTFASANNIPVWWATYGRGVRTNTTDGWCPFVGTAADVTKDWRPFGGYTRGPTFMKQYNGDCANPCGCKIDVNVKALPTATPAPTGSITNCDDFNATIGCASLGLGDAAVSASCTPDSGTATSCETVCCVPLATFTPTPGAPTAHAELTDSDTQLADANPADSTQGSAIGFREDERDDDDNDDDDDDDNDDDAEGNDNDEYVEVQEWSA